MVLRVHLDFSQDCQHASMGMCERGGTLRILVGGTRDILNSADMRVSLLAEGCCVMEVYGLRMTVR